MGHKTKYRSGWPNCCQYMCSIWPLKVWSIIDAPHTCMVAKKST